MLGHFGDEFKQQRGRRPAVHKDDIPLFKEGEGLVTYGFFTFFVRLPPLLIVSLGQLRGGIADSSVLLFRNAALYELLDIRAGRVGVYLKLLAELLNGRITNF